MIEQNLKINNYKGVLFLNAKYATKYNICFHFKNTFWQTF